MAVRFVTDHGLRKVVLSNEGASADIFVHGARATSWIVNGVERLFLSKTSAFGEGKAIRGGIPLCFPQFADRGSLPKHGFVRDSDNWKVEDMGVKEGNAYVKLLHTSSPATMQTWPHDFKLVVTHVLKKSSLLTTLEVQNIGECSLSFSGALHNYFAVHDSHPAIIEGLHGTSYLDTKREREQRRGLSSQVESREHLDVPTGEEIDRIYIGSASAIKVLSGKYHLEIQKEGLPDTVVWNIGQTKEHLLADLYCGAWKEYVCVESAIAGGEIVVPGQQSWVGQQQLHVHH